MDTALSHFRRLDFVANVAGTAHARKLLHTRLLRSETCGSRAHPVATLEYAEKGIRVNSVAPGAIVTPMLQRNPASITEPIRTSIPMQRFGTMDEITAATVWLCSDESSYVTGRILPVEGGYTASCLTVVAPPGTQYDEYQDTH